MKAVILAGGRGTRLAEETSLRPKPMVEIGDRPILWHIMKMYSQHGINDFVICLGYKGYMITEFFMNYSIHLSDVTVDLGGERVTYHRRRAEDWRITLVDTGLDTQTGGRIKAVAPHLNPDEPFCMTYGDGVSDVDIRASIDFHRTHGRLATVTAVTPPGRFGVLETEGDLVTGFREKIANDQYRINAGFFVLDPKVVSYVEEASTIWEQEPMQRLAAEGQLMAFSHNGFWQPMDTLRDRQKLEELWQNGTAPWVSWREEARS